MVLIILSNDSFFFFFHALFSHAKSATKNNHRNELSDNTYQSPFSRDSNDIFPVSRKTDLKF